MARTLTSGDIAAQGALVGLAGTMGIATILAVFFPRRRQTGFAVFEIFVIFAVLTGVLFTAVIAIDLLHANEAVSDRELTETAMPLVIATLLLAITTAASRAEGNVTAYVMFVAAIAAARLSADIWSVKPEDALPNVATILTLGGLVALMAIIGERTIVWGESRRHQRDFLRRRQAGYQSGVRRLRLKLPGIDGGSESLRLRVWTRKSRLYLDASAIERVRRHAFDRWRALNLGKADAPPGSGSLLRVALYKWNPWLERWRWARLSIISPDGNGEKESLELRPNADGLFDVTGLGIVCEGIPIRREPALSS